MFIYADDIAILKQARYVQNLVNTLNEDLNKQLEIYFKRWGLKLNASKTESSCFRLYNWQANTEVKVTFCSTILKQEPCPICLSVKLERCSGEG